MERKVRATRESWFASLQLFGAGFFFFGFLAMT
jgi:hypothetical protein